MTLVSSFTNSLSRKAISKFVGRQFSIYSVTKAIGAAKTALSLHENYDAVQAFGIGNIPSLDGKWGDQIDGHDGGAVGGKASTFAGAETIGLSGTNGPHTTLSAGFFAKTSAAGSVYAFGDYTGSQGWVAGLASGKFQVVAQDAAGNIKNYLSTELFNDGLWHFFFFVIESGVLTLFVDGRSVSVTKTADQSVITIGAGSGSSWRISGYNVNSSRWIGQIQFPMQWNDYALTAQEITLLADSLVLPSTQPDFLGYLIGDKCYDLTGNESTVTGTATITEYSNVDVPVAPFDLDSAGYRSSGGLIIPKRINSSLAADGNALTNTGRAKTNGQLKKGNAVVLSGSEQGSVSDDSPFEISGNLTLACWIRPSTITGDRRIFAFGVDGETEATNTLYTLYYSSGTITYAHEYGAGSNQISSFSASVTIGTSVHVAIVRDATAKTVKLYIDGEYAETYTYTNSPTGGTSGVFSVAAFNDSTFHSGEIWAPHIYDATKTDAEILAIYNGELDTADAVEIWPMCERSGLISHGVVNQRHLSWTATISHSSTVNNVYHYPEAQGYSLYEKGANPDLIVPYLASGSPLTITPPSGYSKTADYAAGAKIRDTGVEVDFDPDGIYQWTDNLWQWADFNGTNSKIDISEAKSQMSIASDFSGSVDFKLDTLTTRTILSATSSSTDRFTIQIKSSELRVAAYDGGWAAKSIAFTDTSSFHTIKFSYDAATHTITATLDGVELTGTNLPDVSGASGAFIGSASSGSSLYWDGQIKNLKIDGGIDMPLAKNCLDLSGNANHGTPTNITFAKQTLNDHAFGDSEPLPTSIDQSISGEESKMIHFTI